jgi:2-dehydropantoate 2-reductase
MKILVYGSGVIGSIYAARLHEAGYDVTLLARGNRYEEISRKGVTINNVLTGEKITRTIPATLELAPTDFYDLIIVTVRLDQTDPLIPIFKRNLICPLLLFMFNNPGDSAHFAVDLYPKHVILGFPGTGGTMRDGQINYIQIRQQKTTLGSIDGKNTVHLKVIKDIFEIARFEVDLSAKMPAWLTTHAVFISCMCAAIIKEKGDSVQLSKNRSAVRSLVYSIREGFAACKALGIPIQPTNLRIIFMVMPRWFGILYWQNALKGKMGTLAIAPHANAARDEMRLLAEKVIAIVHTSSKPTHILDQLLLSFIQTQPG